MLRHALFLLLIGTPCFLHAQTDADAADLARINAAITEVQQQLAGTRDERGAVASEVEASEKAVLDNQRKLDAVRMELAQQQSTLDELHAQQQQLDKERVAQQELIGTYARGAWMAGNKEYLKLVLNQEDPRRSARMVRYYGYFSAARADKIAAFNQTLADLARVAADIATLTPVLEQQQQALALQQDSLASSQQQRQAALARLDEDLAARDAELQGLEMDKVEIELLLQELQNSLSDIPVDDEREPFANRKGLLPWPLEGRHLNAFGSRHDLGDLTWEGITIAATAGTDIRAVHHGRVVFADWFNTSGLLLIIDHGDGYMSLYAHNQELYKAVGEWVSGGDVIAAAGNTGGQRDASLYFEIRRNGRAENPVSWCVAQ